MAEQGMGKVENETVNNTLYVVDIREESAFFVIFSGFLGSSAVLGNLAAVFTILSQSHKFTRTYKLIANLALSDCTTGCIILLFTVILTDKSIVQNDFLCSLIYSLLLFSTSASVNALLLITIDRFSIIVWPLRYKEITSCAKGEITVVAGWMMAFMFAFLPIPNIFGRKHLGNNTCSLGKIFTNQYILLMFSVTYIIPSVIMIILYIKIAMIARKHRQQIWLLHITDVSANEDQSTRVAKIDGSEAVTAGASNYIIQQKARSKEQWKATKTIFIILGYFIFSWLPFYICMLVLSLIQLNEG